MSCADAGSKPRASCRADLLEVHQDAAPTGETGRALVSVKGGKMIGPGMVRDLLGTVETQKAEMGVLVTLTKPTPGMKDAANHAGTYTWPVNAQQFPKIQLFTVEQLLAGKRPQMPPTMTPYIKAQRLRIPAEQMPLDLLAPLKAGPAAKQRRTEHIVARNGLSRNGSRAQTRTDPSHETKPAGPSQVYSRTRATTVGPRWRSPRAGS
jgi:hypothetical protein